MKQAAVQIQQGDTLVTISEGQVPVLRSTTDDLRDEIPMVINFLRSGCPSVQVVYTYDCDNGLHQARKLLGGLTLPDEELYMAAKPSECSSLRIFSMSRKIKPR